MKERAEQLLSTMLGPGACFREGQWEAIEAVAVRRQRVLVVQRTGWGKSLVYFIATRLLRESGSGPTVLISPLLSLMRNQIEMASRIGIQAASINSTNPREWDTVEKLLRTGQCDVLLVSPERLSNPRFLQTTLPSIQGGIGLFVVDEAHCISDWGHDFRPDYRRIVRIVRSLPRLVPVMGTTATANDRVVGDISEQLGPDLQVIRGPLARRSLRLQTIRLADQAERLAWLTEQLPRLPGSGIIYCLTVQDCRRVSQWLLSRGIDVPAYYGGLDTPSREGLEQRLLSNGVKALSATVALGMGFDKPDLGFVIHYQRPVSVIAYYQQIGRAGRAVEDACAVLLNGREDDEIHDYFIRTAFPYPEEAGAVLQAVEASDGLTLNEILQRVNLSRSRAEHALKHLEVEQAVARHGSRWMRTLHPWKPDLERAQRVTEQRRHELRQMREYVAHSGCLMEFLARELDDPAAQPCGRCANCAGAFLPVGSDRRVVQAVINFFRGDSQVITPRRQWPPGGVGGRTGKIPPELQNAEGRALSIYADAGWGRRVAEGKYHEGRFDDELVQAAVEMMQGRWRPQPAPHWVTAVPSLRHPALVPDFARRLARALDLPFHPVLVKTVETPEQKAMHNSIQQAQNVVSAFTLQSPCPSGPVLLVDDVVDSGWTLTVCGCLLREVGAGTVYPLALAVASGGVYT